MTVSWSAATRFASMASRFAAASGVRSQRETSHVPGDPAKLHSVAVTNIHTSGTVRSESSPPHQMTEPAPNRSIPTELNSLARPQLAPASSSETITYSYDSLNRLASAAYATAGTIAYSYDSAGNRTSIQSSSASTTINTSQGTTVTVKGSDLEITFEQVTAGGATSISAINPASVGLLSNGYQLFGSSVAFDINTTASTQGSIAVCFNILSVIDPSQFSHLRLLHLENGVLVDRTGGLDCSSKMICAVTPSLGQFVLALDNDGNLSDRPSSFVSQHYFDFLSRAPDAGGLGFWTNEITSCGADAACVDIKRINVSAAFYLSIEFQETGYLVERIYRTSYGDAVSNSEVGGSHLIAVPIVRLNEFLPDTQKIGQGIVVGQAGWPQALENNKQAFTAEFVQRPRFISAFPTTMTPAEFVDKLSANAGNPLSTTERNQLVNDLSSGAKTRAQVLRAVAENPNLVKAEKNRAFVLMQYFGYLRRTPNDAPDSDYTGYDYWLQKLNQFNGNFVQAEMVRAFIVSNEYRLRFGP